MRDSNEVTGLRPDKLAVREWMQQRRGATEPPPDLALIRQQLRQPTLIPGVAPAEVAGIALVALVAAAMRELLP